MAEQDRTASVDYRVQVVLAIPLALILNHVQLSPTPSWCHFRAYLVFCGG